MSLSVIMSEYVSSELKATLKAAGRRERQCGGMALPVESAEPPAWGILVS